jgi:integrase
VSLYPTLAADLDTPRGSGDLVFVGPKSGKHLWYGRFRTTYWEPAIDKATDVKLCRSLGLTPLSRRPRLHDLRHSHASWLIAAGIPLPYIQVRLGHEKITTTVDTYGHLVADAHEQMASVVSSTLHDVGKPLEIEPQEIVLDVLEGALDMS